MKIPKLPLVKQFHEKDYIHIQPIQIYHGYQAYL